MPDTGMFDRGLEIHSVSFGERIEITYVDPAHISKDVMKLQTLLVNPRVLGAELDEVIETIREWVDSAEVHHRNPPEQIRAR